MLEAEEKCPGIFEVLQRKYQSYEENDMVRKAHSGCFAPLMTRVL